MKSDWIWMPHAGHLIVGNMCRFHLNTCVNGHIVSTVGEYWPDAEVRRLFVKNSVIWPKMIVNEDGHIVEVGLTQQEADKILSLSGDCFDGAYLKEFGYKEIGYNRLYESMVFKANSLNFDHCCPWLMADTNNLDFDCYNDPKEAYEGHLKLCEKWDSIEASTLSSSSS